MKHINAALAIALALFLSLAQPIFALPDDEVRNDESQRTAQQEPKEGFRAVRAKSQLCNGSPLPLEMDLRA